MIKMNGCGNNFVVYDQTDHDSLLEDIFANSAGCDQILLIKNSNNADFFMQIYNRDGGEASACGNGARCVAFLVSKKLGRSDVTLETKSRIIQAQVINENQVAVNMGVAKFLGESDVGAMSLRAEGVAIQDINKNLDHRVANAPRDNGMDHHVGLCPPRDDNVGAIGYMVNIGNDHLVLFSDEYDWILTAAKENPLFFNGININFVQIIDKDQLILRTHERGVGFTASCGSGACASFAVAYMLGYCCKQISVKQDGGILQMSFDADNNIIMTGPIAMGYR